MCQEMIQVPGVLRGWRRRGSCLIPVQWSERKEEAESGVGSRNKGSREGPREPGWEGCLQVRGLLEPLGVRRSRSQGGGGAWGCGGRGAVCAVCGPPPPQNWTEHRPESGGPGRELGPSLQARVQHLGRDWCRDARRGAEVSWPRAPACGSWRRDSKPAPPSPDTAAPLGPSLSGRIPVPPNAASRGL